MENEKNKNTKKGCLGCLSIIVLIALGFLILYFLDEKEKAPIVSVQEYSSRVESALNEIKDPNLSYHEPIKLDDGKTSVALIDNGKAAIRFSEDDKEHSVAMHLFDSKAIGKKSFYNSLRLLIGTVDDSLTMGERQLVLNDLHIDYDEIGPEDILVKSTTKNGIYYSFTYLAEEQIMQLKAEK